MNNFLNLHAPWADVKERLKEANTGLLEEDLEYNPGNEEALLERLAKKMNRTREEIKGWIESVSYTKNIAS